MNKPKKQAGTKSWAKGAIFTVGHSTLTSEDFITLLKAYGIENLADVRTIPRSRHNPQFNSDALAAALEKNHIAYIAMKALGGLRHTYKDSPNKGWRNESFRGYADYMQSPDFERALEDLIETGRKNRTAIMCAEAVPWRCHRSLVADALCVRGIEAVEIFRKMIGGCISSRLLPMSAACISLIRPRRRSCCECHLYIKNPAGIAVNSVLC
jgi:uncharacterized protein (DUF488 family)